MNLEVAVYLALIFYFSFLLWFLKVYDKPEQVYNATQKCDRCRKTFKADIVSQCRICALVACVTCLKRHFHRDKS